MGQVWDALGALFKFLLPNENATEEDIRRWRVKIALVMVLGFASLSGHIMLSKNLVPGIESGFADLSQVQANQQEIVQLGAKLDSKAKSDYEREMFNLRLEQCRAATGSPLRASLAAQIESIQMLYRQLNNGQSFDLPSCTDLVG